MYEICSEIESLPFYELKFWAEDKFRYSNGFLAKCSKIIIVNIKRLHLLSSFPTPVGSAQILKDYVQNNLKQYLLVYYHCYNANIHLKIKVIHFSLIYTSQHNRQHFDCGN